MLPDDDSLDVGAGPGLALQDLEYREVRPALFALHYTALYYTVLHYITLHCTILFSLHYTALYYTVLHFITLHYNALTFTAL